MASYSAIARRIRVPLGFAFAAVYIWLARPTWTSIVCGACIACLGIVVRALASGHVSKNEQLTMSGPYSYLRNPLYFGSIVIAAGFTVASRSWWIAVGAVLLFVVIYIPVIRSEEAFLRSKFPEFEEYSRNVPRLIPRFSRFGGSHGAFSWGLYQKHREYNAIIGSSLMLLILVAKLLWWSK